MIKNITKSSWILGLLIIIAIGGFLRLHHVEDWMHYQLDQARDFRVIDAAIEKGVGELPLQGPKAAGNVYIDSDGDGEAEDKTTLRLGPLFYYMEYVSALIFGNTPIGSIMLSALLSIATIPLFYFFLREFFRENLALSLTALLATSLFFIVYSRFGWNPNLIPFFALGTAYSLLQASKGYARQGRWLIATAISFAFLANMHFLALTVFPVICVIYLLWTRPMISWRYWLIAVCVFVGLNTPLIINDVKTGGENYKAFIASVQGDAGDEDVHIGVKLIRNGFEHTQMAWVVLTGDQAISTPRISKTGDLTCDEECKSALLKSLVSILMLGAMFVAWIWLLRRTREGEGKNFLRIVGLWSIVTFLIYTPLAFDFAPRFFLLQAPMFIVFFGLLIEMVAERDNKRMTYVVHALLLVAIIANTFFVAQYFDGLKKSASEATFELAHSDRILKEKTRVTLSQMESIVDEMIADYTDNNEQIFLEAQAEYKRAFWERVESRDGYPLGKVGDLRTRYNEGNYYIVIRTQSDFDNYFEKFAPYYDIRETQNFGTLTLYTLDVKQEVKDQENLADRPEITESPDPQFSSSAQVRYLWRQVFEGCTYNYNTRKCEK